MSAKQGVYRLTYTQMLVEYRPLSGKRSTVINATKKYIDGDKMQINLFRAVPSILNI